jgi:hypothetical protein
MDGSKPTRTHCRSGHDLAVAEVDSQGRCMECARARSRRWRERHPDEAREKERRQREKNPENRRRSARRRYAADPEKFRARARKRRAEDPEGARERDRARYVANPNVGRDSSSKWRTSNPEDVVRGRRRQTDTIRREALLAYGDGSCALCGATDAPLELDHVNGDGVAHRKALGVGGAGAAFRQRLKRLGWPNDPPLQTLCKPCHKTKTHNERTTK